MKKKSLPPTEYLDRQLAAARHVEIIVTASGKSLYLFGNQDIRDAGTEVLRSAIRDLGFNTSRVGLGLLDKRNKSALPQMSP